MPRIMKLDRYIDHDSQMTPIDFEVTSSYMYFFTNMTLIYKQEQTTVSSILTELLPLLYLEYAYY